MKFSALQTLIFFLRLMLASADGYFYIYNIPEEGGDCIMVKQHRVDPECSEAPAADQPSVTPPDSPAVIPVTQVRIYKLISKKDT